MDMSILDLYANQDGFYKKDIPDRSLINCIELIEEYEFFFKIIFFKVDF